MDRNHVAKLNSNAGWAAAYRAALAEAEATHGAGTFEALEAATEAADVAVERQAEAAVAAQRASDYENYARAHGKPAAQPEPAKPDHAAAWRQAIAKVNAG